jgi:hypothetical protein
MDDLKRLKKRDLLKTVLNFPAENRNDTSRRAFFLSVAIVKYFLGKAWVETHLNPELDEPGYLRLKLSLSNESEEASFRVVDLAELLFNLQHRNGFDSCITRMREGLVESTYAELDFGRMLHGNRINFRFVKPTGKRGSDYDIEIMLPDGVNVCADAKCKIENSEFSEQTIINTLHGARGQFPTDRPSAIFIKCPTRWFVEDQAGNEAVRIAENWLRRNTKRIVSVKFYMSRLVWKDGQITHVQLFKEISNPHNRFDPNRNWDMFGEGSADGGKFEDWMHLVGFPSLGMDMDQ